MRKVMLGLGLSLALLGVGEAASAVTNTAVNLRRVPQPNGAVVRVVPGGTVLTVACEGQWCRTSYRGRGGYVYRPLLRPLTVSAPLSGRFFRSCAQMRAQGMAPLRIGTEGYRVALDTNRNGLACDAGDRR